MKNVLTLFAMVYLLEQSVCSFQYNREGGMRQCVLRGISIRNTKQTIDTMCHKGYNRDNDRLGGLKNS